VERGKSKCPGRLSFHTVHLSSSPGTPNEAPPPPFLVLADGAHNPASAVALGNYISSLLIRTIISTKEGPNYQAQRKPICINFNITFILSLSHSPPKTPFQTLSPLFPLDISIPPSSFSFGEIKISTTISVGLLRFTPPEGMPWIKCVPPTDVEAVVKGLMDDAEVWVVPDADVDNKVENGPEEKSESALEKALMWAAGKMRRTELNKPIWWFWLEVFISSLIFIGF
jgi:dihydrofolate synthase